MPHFELLPYKDTGEQHVSGLLCYYDTAIDVKNKGCFSEAFMALSSLCLFLSLISACLLWNWHFRIEMSPVSCFSVKTWLIRHLLKYLFCSCVYQWSNSGMCVLSIVKKKKTLDGWKYKSSVCHSLLLKVYTGSNDYIRERWGCIRWPDFPTDDKPVSKLITPSLSSQEFELCKLNPEVQAWGRRKLALTVRCGQLVHLLSSL